MKPDISVVICTHNRSAYLSKAINSLVEQDLSKDSYEVIVVDNCSTDFTKDVVGEFSNRANIIYIFEPTLGLSYARNTGWRSSNGKYVAYLDDDAIASNVWLSKILQAFETTVPKPGCVGGRTDPIWEARRPPWLSDHLLHILGIINWSNTPHFLHNIREEWLVGTNISFRIDMLERLGGFTPGLDRVGKNLLSNGDIHIQKKIMKAGYSCYYHPEIVVSHHIFPSRLKKDWFIQRYYWQGISDSVMLILEESQSVIERVTLASSKSLSVLKSPRKLMSLLLPTNNPRRFTEKCFNLITVGQISGLLKAIKK